MSKLNDIAANLYPVCYDVERHIVGHDERDAIFWARSNAVRHAHTVRIIMAQTPGKRISILNASGLSCGHQDFSLASYLRSQGVDFSWRSCESPQSPYLHNPVFMDHVKRLGIDLYLSDFASEKEMYGAAGEVYDVVLFTEIAEHLDHSTFLKALRELRNKVAPGGVLVLTTPNLVSLLNRIRIFSGDADSGIFWGDGALNMANGLYGHIVAYDRRRLLRLLADAGFDQVSALTFNYASRKFEGKVVKRVVMTLVDLLSQAIPDSGSTLLAVVSPGTPKPIPLQI